MASEELKAETQAALDEIVLRVAFAEFNNQETRDNVISALYEYLNDNVSVQKFAVKCDEDNNTPERIDRSEFYADVAVLHIWDQEFTYYPLFVGKANVESNSD